MLKDFMKNLYKKKYTLISARKINLAESYVKVVKLKTLSHTDVIGRFFLKKSDLLAAL